MKKILILFMAILIFSGLPSVSKAASNEELLRQIKMLQQKLAELEKKVEKQQTTIEETKKNQESVREINSTNRGNLGNLLKTGLKDTTLNLGASTGYFYATNSGKNISKDKFIISNFMIGLDYAPTDLPVSFSGAYGGTATPSLLDSPADADTQPTFDIEYADFTITPFAGFSLELGLLAPNAGYEDTYTYNNKNITVGVLASQQPYNAYGTRVNYSINGLFDVYAGFYEDRKDAGEYAIDNGVFNGKPGNSWEAGISGTLCDADYTLYYYNVNNMRRLLGFVVEKTINNIYMAFNADYWNWNKKWNNYYSDKSSLGVSFYISPKFKKIELPLRIEYINQGNSKIYVENTEADNIFAITFTPTYNFSDSAYFRIESGYVNSNKSFENNNGNLKDSKFYFSSEVGLKF